VSGEYALTDNELTMFAYRGTVRCLALLDAFISCLSILNGAGLWFLVVVAGPLLGVSGAGQLRRAPVAAYLVFCFLKLFYYMLLLFETNGVAVIVLVYLLIQIWVTRIVLTFSRNLNTIPEERLIQLRDPAFLPSAMQAHRDFRARFY